MRIPACIYVYLHYSPPPDVSGGTDTDEEVYHDPVRPITMEDLVTSVNKMRMSKVHTGNPMMKLELD